MDANLNDAPCLYFTATTDGYIIDINGTTCRQLGYQKEELTGKKLETIFTLPTRIFQQTHLFPLLKMQGHAAEIYITLQRKDKTTLPVLVNAQRRQNGEEEVYTYVGITVFNRKKFEDELIAARKAAERALSENSALLQAKEELQQQARQLDQQISLATKQNEELREFSRIITHDVQEPLRKLFVFTDLLLQNSGVDPTRTIQKLQSFTEQMRSIISGLQQYIWLTETPPTFVELDLATILSETRQAIEEENKGVTLCVKASALPLIKADREQFHFLFFELLSNAVRFRNSPEKCTVSISADVITQNSFRAVAGKYTYVTYNRLQLKDDGQGFDPAYREHVFKLFKRLHPESRRGIGLSLCKKIVDNHGGSISVESRPGEGTTIHLLLPVNSEIQ